MDTFEEKEKAALVNFATAVGSALGTVAAKTTAVTKPAVRRKAAKKVKAEAKKQVKKVRKQAKKLARKVKSSARKVRRRL
jgi:hypothetical protein